VADAHAVRVDLRADIELAGGLAADAEGLGVGVGVADPEAELDGVAAVHGEPDALEVRVACRGRYMVRNC
jgi:hypothetical protein